MGRHSLHLLIGLFFSLSLQALAARHLVLVPGFFNSAVPAPIMGGNPWKQPYFSQDIISYLTTSGEQIWVVDTLNPLGSVEENGEKLLTFLQNHREQLQGPILLIGHSAGGLYSLYAAARSDLEINQIITISTPFAGLEFLDTLERNHIPVSKLAAPFSLGNLLQLRNEKVQAFLSDLKFQKPIRVDVFAGYQGASIFTWDWKNLSQPMLPFQALTQADSDGIVSVRSSLAAGALKAKRLLNLQIHPEPIELEHWEFNLDAKLMLAFGVVNIPSLQTAQKWAYYNLLKQSSK
ncbi:MAG: alpha/beta fold hydrolase [Pseudobdellovibrionaceae bacterium]